MDTFIEKIVAKKKTAVDHLITVVTIVAACILIMVSLSVGLGQIGFFLAIGIAYGGYYFITSRNVEYEYIVTNGELDIDKITARRKRKRIFSASCKEFEILSRVKSNSFSQSVQNIKKRIDVTGSINSPDAFFATLNYKGERTLLIFEPSERMLNNFKIYIPRKMQLN